jgi:hypothetical protein
MYDAGSDISAAGIEYGRRASASSRHIRAIDIVGRPLTAVSRCEGCLLRKISMWRRRRMTDALTA